MPVNRRTFLRYGATTAAAVIAAGTGAGVLLGSPALAVGSVPWPELAGRLAGPLVLPTDADFAAAERVYFSHYDTPAPSAVAYCTSEADVHACITFAQRYDLPAVPRSGGHSHAGFSTTTGLVIDLTRLNSAALTGSGPGGSPLVVLGPGTRQIDALTTLAPQGYALVGGGCPTVAAGGFVQGGGYGLLTRRNGMSCDRLVSARVVLADGRVVTASARENPDLFWALRGGGGGNFGVVTQYRVRPVALTQLGQYALTWPFTQAAAVLAAWQDWVVGAPWALGGGFTLAASPAAGGVPQLSVSGGWTGSLDALDAVLDTFVAAVGTAPTVRSANIYSYQDSMMSVYGCGTLTAEQCHLTGTTAEGMLQRGNFLAVRNRMFDDPMPAADTAALVAAFEQPLPTGHVRLVSGAALGGAANLVGRTDTAYAHRTTRFQLIAVDTTPASADPGAADQAAAAAWTERVFAAIDPASNGESYQNMPDPALADWQAAYYAENYGRLTEVKQAYDPYGFFSFAQAVGR
ncbi:FAD-dependent oxidoreductase [Streptomyces sp. NPDC056161]|uniref:FAD-dependent oxidoreductase n=1 Tax=Streptomyces sp. NPDC056161 TaxID=3345732 RepID=UPI0035E04700